MKIIIALLLLTLTTLPSDKFTSFAGFDLGKATLNDVQKTYGMSRLRESGDAGEYKAWICYLVPAGEVQFNSGEMGAGSSLLGFTINAEKSADDCPTPVKPLPNEIGGIKLGISRKQFTSAVRHPIVWENNVGTAVFEHRSETRTGTPVDISITLIATFGNSGLKKLTVWKIETT